MPEISLHQVSKTYNPGLFSKKIQAVTDLCFRVYKGEVFGIVGPNGAGKSTTIRLILGLIRPDKGAIKFRESLPTPFLNDVGYLPENPYLYDHLTLEELLTFCGRSSGLSCTTIRMRIDELLLKLDMNHAKKRPLRTFSKGMLQRAGICFSLLHDPSVIILDEPMSGLDPIGRKMVFDLVSELKTKGKTIFFCSHILTDVERLCDRIGIMVGGCLVRTLERNEIAEPSAQSLHLLVSQLTERQRTELHPLVENIEQERGRSVISLRPDALAGAVEKLKTMEVEVLGSRSERFSLEEIFMQAVEKNR